MLNNEELCNCQKIRATVFYAQNNVTALSGFLLTNFGHASP